MAILDVEKETLGTEIEMAAENGWKRSTPRARLMVNSCWVSMEGLLKSFCKVRGVMPIWSASHWFV